MQSSRRAGRRPLPRLPAPAPEGASVPVRWGPARPITVAGSDPGHSFSSRPVRAGDGGGCCSVGEQRHIGCGEQGQGWRRRAKRGNARIAAKVGAVLGPALWMRPVRHTAPTLLVLPFLLLAVGCDDRPIEPESEPPGPAAVHLTPTRVEPSALGSTSRLTAELRDQCGKSMT